MPHLRGGIIAHFEAHRRRSTPAFFWWITAESLAFSAVLAAVLGLLMPDSGTEWPEATPAARFAQIVLLAPIIETLLFQTIPVGLARWAGGGFRGQLLAAWLPFATLHFFNGFVSGVAAGVVGGFYLAFAYVHWRECGLGRALGLTILSHALHNLLVFAGATLSEAP